MADALNGLTLHQLQRRVLGREEEIASLKLQRGRLYQKVDYWKGRARALQDEVNRLRSELNPKQGRCFTVLGGLSAAIKHAAASRVGGTAFATIMNMDAHGGSTLSWGHKAAACLVAASRKAIASAYETLDGSDKQNSFHVTSIATDAGNNGLMRKTKSRA